MCGSQRVTLLALFVVLALVLGRHLPIGAWVVDLRQWLLGLGPWAMPAFICALFLWNIVLPAGLSSCLLVQCLACGQAFWQPTLG